MSTPEEFTRRTIRRIGAAITASVICLIAVAIWRTSPGQKILFWAVEEDHFTVARLLLAAGLDPNGDPEAASPLNRAAMCGPRFVQLLLEKGADPNRADHFGNIPLRAISDSCPTLSKIVDMLAAAGADFRACSGSPLLAVSTVEEAHALLEHGADPNQTCSPQRGENALNHIARYPDVLRFLLDNGAKIVTDRLDESTPLHDAADLGGRDYETEVPARLKSAQVLLDHGADVNAVDKKGRTALDIAYEHGDKEMADILVKHGGKAKKYDSLEAGEEAAESATEYQDLYAVAEGVRKGPACSLVMHGDNHAIMEEGPNWSIIQGTVGVVRVNCHASGYFHYAVVGMGSPVPKRLNMPLMGGLTSERITFDQPWSNGVMHFYYSAEPIKNLVRAINRGDATHFAVRYVNVGR